MFVEFLRASGDAQNTYHGNYFSLYAVCKIKLEKIKKAICDRLLSIPNQKKGNHK